MAATKVSRPAAVRAPRVAVLVDTSTTWGREIITGVHSYARIHGRWQLYFEARGPEEIMGLPGGWQGEGRDRAREHAAAGRAPAAQGAAGGQRLRHRAQRGRTSRASRATWRRWRGWPSSISPSAASATSPT